MRLYSHEEYKQMLQEHQKKVIPFPIRKDLLVLISDQYDHIKRFSVCQERLGCITNYVRQSLRCGGTVMWHTGHFLIEDH